MATITLPSSLQDDDLQDSSTHRAAAALLRIWGCQTSMEHQQDKARRAARRERTRRICEGGQR